MLIPRRVKHRKQHHPSRSGATKGGSAVAFGDYGIQALEPAYVTNRQIEAARRVISRSLGKTGRIWIRIFPDRPFTKKAAEVATDAVAADAEAVVEAAPAKPKRVTKKAAAEAPAIEKPAEVAVKAATKARFEAISRSGR